MVGGSQNQKKPQDKSEAVENIVALAVFGVLILLVIAFFTQGFGLWAKKETSVDFGQRINVPLEADAVRGNISSAPITIIIFSDFQCPFCKKGEETVMRVYNKYPGQVALVFKHFPLTNIHPNAYNAALAAECAGEQGKFWEYHDLLFARQDALDPSNLKLYAGEIRLDTSKFDTCVESQTYKYNIDRDVQVAKTVGVSGTPTFFINGYALVGSQPESEFDKIIQSELNRISQK